MFNNTSIPVLLLSSLATACPTAAAEVVDTFGDESPDTAEDFVDTGDAHESEESTAESGTEDSEDSATESSDSDETGDEGAPCEQACANGACDPDSGACACDVGYHGDTCEEVFSDCKALLEAFPDAPSGLYTLDPSGEEPFDAYCDMTTDGGGWMVVFKNHGGAKGGEVSNLVLLEGDPEGFKGAIPPHTKVLKSGINDKAWAFYMDRGGLEWLKDGTLWDPNDIVIHNQHLRVNFGPNTWSWILSQPGDKCIEMPGAMSVVLDGEYYLGSTNQFLQFNGTADFSFGLANNYAGEQDLCEQGVANLISEHNEERYASIRHLFSYRHPLAGADASRCQFMCWSADTGGHYDGFTWMVRPI